MIRGWQVELKVYSLDLHIHTVLSPCTEIADMTPKVVVRTAAERGLDVIAVCDHNSARNTAATKRAAKGTGLTVLPGIEVTSLEEVHIVGLFGSVEAALVVQEEVYARLPGENDEDVFGYQVVVNENDEVEDMDDRLLIGATTLSAERVVELIHRVGGLAVPAHVDREGFGIFSKLGFIPESMKVDALEVSKRSTYQGVREKFPQCRDYTLITSSDAHTPEDVGIVSTKARMAEPSFEELKMALKGLEGRGVLDSETD
jgi:PHP family Zn ribbon phosphoesterase